MEIWFKVLEVIGNNAYEPCIYLIFFFFSKNTELRAATTLLKIPNTVKERAAHHK